MNNVTIWKSFRGEPRLGANQVHVWFVEFFPEAWNQETYKGFLSDPENARAEHFRFKKDQKPFTFSRGILRLLLSRYLNIQPGDLSLSTTASGKPFLSNNKLEHNIYFNLSHSGNLVAYAFVWDREIGIDLESINPIPDLAKLADKYLSVNENAKIQLAAPDDRLRLFLQNWTRKEAWLKACGKGLDQPLNDIDFSSIPIPASILTPINPEKDDDQNKWSLIDFSPTPASVASLVVEGYDQEISFLNIDETILKTSF